MKVHAGMIVMIFLAAFTAHSAGKEAESIRPPMPGALIDAVYQVHHPLLLGDRVQFRDARRWTHTDLFRDRAEEFKKRVEGYFNEKSPWYLGVGPFQKTKTFDPMGLDEDDFSAYQSILLELVVFIGVEQERWAIQHAKTEYLRWEEQGKGDSIQSLFTQPPRDDLSRNLRLLSCMALLYDSIYSRFETIERHAKNNQWRSIHDTLAQYSHSLDLNRMGAEEQILMGTTLGLTTLLCISLYPTEGEKTRPLKARLAVPYPVQSLLPDLYGSANATEMGLRGFQDEAGTLQLPLRTMARSLELAIPWIECMRRLGYPFVIESGSYARLAAALEIHRIPQTSLLLQPSTTGTLQSPWIPDITPLLASIDPSMFQEIKATGAPSASPENQGEEETEMAPPDGLPDMGKNPSAVPRPNSRAMTLREMLERYGQPRKPTPAPAIAETPADVTREGGWSKPKAIQLPSIWSVVYLLAALENPRTNFGEYWSQTVIKVDSNPYNFLYWRAIPRAQAPPERTRTFLRYPESRFALFKERSPYGDYLLGSQASAQTVLYGTFEIQNESFFLSENGTQWRWHHEIPITAALAAINLVTGTTTTTMAAPLPVSAVPRKEPIPLPKTEISLNTSLYACWTTYAPAGKTIVVRRLTGGLGSPYSIVAHYPDRTQEENRQIAYINFQMEPEAGTQSDTNVTGLLRIIPPEAAERMEPTTLIEWQRQRRAERSGAASFKLYGKLSLLFSPESLRRASLSDGILGRFLETELENRMDPFFYLAALEQPGRETFAVEYASLPLQGVRVLAWKQGVEVIAINLGKGIDNDFIQSDADLVLLSRDTSYSVVFYLMVNGTRLQAKFSPKQQTWLTLASVKGTPVTAAWAERRIHTNAPPGRGSVFYAPNIVGFDCSSADVEYGRKARQAVVLGP